MTSKMIAVSLPEGLIKLLDAEVSVHFESRSEYIKRAIIARMEADGVNIAAPPRTYEEVRHKKLADFLASYDSGEITADVDDGEGEDI